MRRLLISIMAIAGALQAQEVVAPTNAQVGTARGDTVGNYTVTQSYEFGYRFKQVGGDEGMYRSVVNIGNGLRLLGSNLSVNSKDGHGHYFDEILLNTIGLGNDNYQAATFRIQKNRLYRYDMTWRLNAYYNPALTVGGATLAGPTHLMDTIRRLQDHDLTFFPQSFVRFRLGYSRDTEDGPVLTTLQEFDPSGVAFPVFADVRRHWNEYRLAADADLAGFRFTIQHRWDFYKDDTPYRSPGTFITPLTSNGQSALTSFQSSQPVHGSNPGWLGNVFTRRKLWGANARLTYTSGTRDFALVESALGLDLLGAAAARQVAVGGSARRPDLAGDVNLSLYPSERLTVVNNTSVISNRIDGDSSYTEVNNGTSFGTNLSFRYLGIRMVTNSTDVNYRARKWIGVYAGYHYSDRLIRTIEGLSGVSSTYEVSNHLNSGTLGIRLRPVKPLTINLDGELGRASNPLTPIADRNYHSLNGRVEYRTNRLQLSTSYRQVYNLNAPFSLSYFSSHSRQYSANASWAPRSTFAIDVAYNHLHLDTLSSLAFFAGIGSRPQLQTGYSSVYVSNIHNGSITARIGILKRADLFVGYALVKDTGDGRSTAVPVNTGDPIQALLTSVQTFPLTYQSPMARLSIRIAPKIRWNAGYQFYSYGERFHLSGFNQNFDAHTGFTSVLWSF